MNRQQRLITIILVCLLNLPLIRHVQGQAATAEQKAAPAAAVTANAATAVPYLVKDIFPGNPTSGLRELRALGSSLLFVADDGNSGSELWKSDGTAAGTLLVKDINPGAAPSGPQELTLVGDTLFFLANRGVNRVELWKSNGTSAGTVLVKTLYQGARGLTAVSNTLFFLDNNRNELWKSDGTSAGTVLVQEINPGPASVRPQVLTAAGNTLYFFVDAGNSGDDLWQSDGTTAGTVSVKDIKADPASRAQGLTAVGNTLFFEAYDSSGVHELWKSDGTAAGTLFVKAIGEAQDHLLPFQMKAVGSTLFFSANDYQFHNGELWKSDGSAAGTIVINRVTPGSYGNLVAVGDTLFYTADDDPHGTELWKSDGTPSGTVLVKDIQPGGAGSFPNALAAAGNRLFFSARTNSNGSELWESDGSEAGTFRVNDTQPGQGPLNPGDMTVAGDKFFFTANDSSHGNELWVLSLTPGADKTILLSTSNNGTIGNLAYRDEDILAYHMATSQWELVFDGSDVGLGNIDVDAFALLPNDHLLLSVDKDFNLVNFGPVDESDILEFAPTALGPVTAGTFSRYFDGSDVGLTSAAEDIDGIDFGVQNVLRLSVVGAFSAPGPGGNTTGADEDLFRFRENSFGENTSGDFAILFDGSDVGLTTASEDVRDTWTDSNEDIYLVTLGNFKVDGVSGDGNDIFICHPTSFGATTACQFRFFWEGGAAGLGKNLIDGLHIGALPTAVNAAAIETATNALDDTNYYEGDDQNEADELDGEEVEEPPTTGDETVREQIYLPLITR